MKKILATLVLSLASLSSFAEATFDQIQVLIQQQNYSAAEKGLEEIIRNHPKSAKAFYAMSQAQAGLGNQDKAKKALDIATGLNPTLDFAPQSSVASLKDAITPQVKKIEAIEESHVGSYLLVGLLFIIAGGTIYVLYNRKKDAEAEAERQAGLAKLKAERQEQDAARKRDHMAMLAQQEAEREALRAHPNYGNAQFDPKNPDVLIPLPKKKTKAELKAESDAQELRDAKYRAERAEAKANEEAALARGRESYARMNATPTVIHTNNSGSDMLTGVLIGNMLSSSSHNHESTRVIERERVVEREAPSRSSSWDDTPSSSSSRSSSWDDTPSKSSSSSWDSGSSSSSSSSSWDSGSSSSDSSSSSSSSSWD